jgi:hypothetical protein
MESDSLGFPFELGPTRTIKSGFRENASHSSQKRSFTSLHLHGYVCTIYDSEQSHGQSLVLIVTRTRPRATSTVEWPRTESIDLGPPAAGRSTKEVRGTVSGEDASRQPIRGRRYVLVQHITYNLQVGVAVFQGRQASERASERAHVATTHGKRTRKARRAWAFQRDAGRRFGRRQLYRTPPRRAVVARVRKVPS